jgi:hypothetical protein
MRGISATTRLSDEQRSLDVTSYLTMDLRSGWALFGTGGPLSSAYRSEVA